MMKKVAIVYARFGPYHIARLHAAYITLNKLEWNVIGIEVCPDDDFNGWDKTEKHDGPDRVAVLPGRIYRECSRKEIQKGMFKTLNTELPDVVALPGWYYAEAVAGLRWCIENKRVPILMSETWQHTKRPWWKEWIKKKRIRQFAAALAGGSPQAHYLMALGMRKDQVFLGHNVVDNDYFSVHSDEARASDADLRHTFRLPDQYILTSGRFVNIKNFPRLLQAYRLYYDEFGESALSLVLCGDGEERQNIEGWIRKLSLQEKVVLPGFVQYEELPIYYGLASVFVHPGMLETWGLVVNEAMASGLPVLVSNYCGCVSDLVVEGVNGYTFDPYNIEQMADRILKMHRRKKALVSMGQASRKIIADWSTDRFSQGLWQAMCVAKGIENNGTIE